MELQHLEAAHQLNFQLGYEIPFDAFKENYKRLIKSPMDDIFVFIDQENVMGWIHLKERHLLQGEVAMEVVGLVVDEKSRGKGVGKALLLFAEDRVRMRGLKKIILTSNIIRTEAHKFYESLGFKNIKLSKRFEKKLLK
jgi:ribosomal protein S18 acetylase RimI-like enzyme